MLLWRLPRAVSAASIAPTLLSLFLAGRILSPTLMRKTAPRPAVLRFRGHHRLKNPRGCGGSAPAGLPQPTMSGKSANSCTVSMHMVWKFSSQHPYAHDKGASNVFGPKLGTKDGSFGPWPQERSLPFNARGAHERFQLFICKKTDAPRPTHQSPVFDRPLGHPRPTL